MRVAFFAPVFTPVFTLTLLVGGQVLPVATLAQDVAVLVADRTSQVEILSLTQADESAPLWMDHFAFENAEKMLEQGKQLMAATEYAEAEQAFAQAVQFSRVNQGLRDPGQIAMVDYLLDALLSQGKWDEFDQQLEYLHWLNSVAYDADVDAHAQGLVNLSDWHRAAAASFSDSRNSWYLVKAKHLNWQAISLLEGRYGSHDVKLAPLLYRIVVDHYYLAVSTQRRGLSSYEFKSDSKIIANGWSMNSNEMANRSYNIGKEILQRIAALYDAAGNAPRAAQGLNLIALADWELLFDNGTIALDYYLAGAEALLDAGFSNQEIDSFFSTAVILPVRNFSVQWPEQADDLGRPAVLRYVAWSRSYPGAQFPDDLFLRLGYAENPQYAARATVEINLHSNIGSSDERELSPKRFNYRVGNHKVVDAAPESSDLAGRIEQELAHLQFRPRINNGKIDVHQLVTLDYVFASD